IDQGVGWRKFSNEGVQDDEGVHEKESTDTEIFVQEVTPTEFIQDQEGSEKVSDEVSTAGLKKGPVSEEVPTVSTAEATLSTAGGTVTYSRRSAEKRSRKDKGKAILIEEEPKKKSKKDLEQEQLSYAEAIRLEEQMNEEQRAQIARDEEIARQWDEEERKRAMDAAESTKKIDCNDPSVIRYHSLKMKPKSIAQARRNMIKYLKNQGNYKISDFKGMSYNDIRPIFEKIWDFNQNIKPMDAEQGSGKQKSPQKSPEKSPEKEKSTKKVVEEEAVTQGEREEVVKEPATKRKKSIPRKTTRKRQKLEEDPEKDELKGFLDIVPREEAPIEAESLSTKFPIVDWKTCVLTETFMYYQVFRGDGSSKNYKVLSEMLEDFDRMDVEQLFRLVKERYNTSAPEGFDLMLWGDLHTLFEPDNEDEIWRDQHEYNLLSWRLCDFCGIHILLMDNGLAIHMLTKKKYPLSQEMLSKMLSRKLEPRNGSQTNQADNGECSCEVSQESEEVGKGFEKGEIWSLSALKRKNLIYGSGREEQMEDINPNTLEAAKTLSRVAFLKPKSIDKGRGYKRRKETKGKKVVSSLVFQEEFDTGAKEVDTGAKEVNTAKGVNTGSIKLSTVSEQVSTGSEQVSTVSAKRSTPSPDKGQRAGKAPMIIEETPKKAKIEANAELSKSMLGSDLQGEDFAKKMVDLINQRKKYFAEERARAKRNNPMTQSQLKTYMMNYLRIQGDMEDISAEEVCTKIPINHVPVAMKSPSIATYKIIKQGEKGVYQIVREDGTDIVYINFGAMLKDISRDDSYCMLYRIVMNDMGSDGPEHVLEIEKSAILIIVGDIMIKAMLDKKLQGGKLDENCYKMLKMMEKQAGIRK
ncbi:hypothetical protein Tco_0561267, partial [Tanacetum coccineum]